MAVCPFAARVSAGLAEPGGRLGAELAAHLPGCPACREAAADAMRRWPPATLPEWLRTPGESATLSEFQAAAVASGRTADLELGPYLLLDRIGAGGMGEVYRARHRFLRRTDAVKVIRPEIAAHPNALKRFLREAEAAAKLRHPNVVQVYTADRAGPGYYLAMEYVAGSDLGKAARARGPLPVAEACEYARQAAEGLQHAFAHGLVHRDVKPANLLLAEDRDQRSEDRKTPGLSRSRLSSALCPLTSLSVKVADFGLARVFVSEDPDGEMTATGAVLGTTDYMAPEQADDPRSADTRSDVYSLGCTLFYLLAGRVPFPGSSLRDKLNRHAAAEVPPLSDFRSDVPPEVEEVVRKCMAKRPQDRFQTPGELAEALREVTVPVAVPVGTPPPADFAFEPEPPPPDELDATRSGATDETRRHEPPRPKRRWSLAWLAAALLVLASAVVLVVQLSGERKPDGGAKPEQKETPKETPKTVPQPKAVAAGDWKPVGEFRSTRTDAGRAVGFGANGEVIAAREGGKDGADAGWVEVWHPGGGDPIRSGRPKGLATHAHPRAVSPRDGSILYHDLTRYGTGDGFPKLEPLNPTLDGWRTGARAESIEDAVFNSGHRDRPAGKYVLGAVTASSPKGKHRFVVLWDLVENRPRSAPEVQTGHDIPGVAVDREGEHAAASTLEGVVHVWNMYELRRAWPTAEVPDKYSGVAMAPDGKTVYAWHPGEQAVVAWDVDGDKRRGRKLECPWPAKPLLVSPDGRWLVAAGNGLRLWDLDAESPRAVTLWEEWKGQFWTVAFAPDGKRLVAGGKVEVGRDRSTGGVWVWELKP